MTRLQRWGQYTAARPGVRGVGVVLAGLGLVGLAVVYGMALWKMPAWMGLEGKGGDAKDRHNARLLVVSAGGAVVVAVSLLYTARNYRLSHRGQVTDRFTKALERLSSSDVDARLGGIYTLAQVATDSRPHHNDVVEVLEAFVRRCAPAVRPDNDGGPSLGRPRRLPDEPDADVQAALTALGSRPHRPERRTLNLSRLYLHAARLESADLRAANLVGADLVRADLVGAHLVRADLMGATLARADLVGADLVGADLQGASLEGADLREADLRDAILVGASLARADLVGADLRGANLWGAYLPLARMEGADLRGANLRDATLSNANLREAHLVATTLKDATLRDADLEGADLRNANLEGTNLEGTNLEGITGMPAAQIRAVTRVNEHTRF
ncbi:pentapeptide repeat-containing protein [Actinomadura syzygii]|uniref:Pentapeptide repeat-containing protein n=1 Tax=Actinomadura syzygii TaxID=1427538 RepID=A0A5D0TS03_9ACTN|nr:pentapeptide repeat-containing protein [Actinomadura syzygii]TYC08627.1 pentapeptide repeat-containing protein [Actinomadura syzygii]